MAGFIFSAYGIKSIISYILKKNKENNWSVIADKARKERDKKISEFLDKNRKDITEEKIHKIISLNLFDLAENIKKKNLFL